MTAPSSLSLPPGYKLQNYIIDKQLSSGGFSIVYLAHDETSRAVAIKEYMPNSLVMKRDGGKVVASSNDEMATFRYGLKCFFEEGHTLAAISHPNIVRVENFFRDNDTVYMVMQYEQGRTLQREILQRQRPLKEEMIRRVFYHLLNGLREVHANKLLHLDIKPANIYIRIDGSPLLLDFGSARQALTFDRPRFTPMYTPGFAAPEQYTNREELGPWSDIYSIGASMFACLAGFAPQAADQRLREDRVTSTKKLWRGKYSEQLLELIDWCLLLNHLERPQSSLTVQKVLAETPVAGDGQRTTSMLEGLKTHWSRLTGRDGA